MTTVLAAELRVEVGDFLAALLQVYVILIIAYILTQLFFGFGGRMPYNRYLSAVVGFLEQVVAPYLNIFRRFIPPIGPIDISPIVGILLLQILGGLIVRIVRGY
ncbi:MAG: YggT family protein [Solirubrobacterales bacterium]|jgi:YggT family protein|nr:YggT family protein [Solirubrobacterales bacterium]